MIKFLVLIVGVILIISGLVYLVRQFLKLQQGTATAQTINKKGILAAIAALVIGAIFVYKNTKIEK